MNVGRIAAREAAKLGRMEDSPEARAVYDALASRIGEFMSVLQPGEKMIVMVDGIAVTQMAIRGALLWFLGKNAEGREISVALHYTQAKLVFVRASLAKGEVRPTIGFLD
jgi:hypothetical protein